MVFACAEFIISCCGLVEAVCLNRFHRNLLANTNLLSPPNAPGVPLSSINVFVVHAAGSSMIAAAVLPYIYHHQSFQVFQNIVRSSCSSDFDPRPRTSFLRNTSCLSFQESNTFLSVLSIRRLPPLTTLARRYNDYSSFVLRRIEAPLWTHASSSTQPTTESEMPVQQPAGWLPAHDAFVRALARNGEDAKCICILLETQFPNMLGRVSKDWVAARVRPQG